MFEFDTQASNATIGVLLAYFALNTAILIPGLTLLWLRRRHPVIRFRNILPLSFAVCFCYLVSAVESASIILGKPRFCEVSSALYAVFPMFSTYFLFQAPMVLAQAEGYTSNKAIKESYGTRVTKILHKHRSLRAFIALTIGVLGAALYVGIRFRGGVVADVGECSQAAIFSLAVTTVVLTLLAGYFFGRLWWVHDPFFLRFEILLTSFYCFPGAIVLTLLYGFGPQIFPAWFDYRGVWVFVPSVFQNVLFPLCLTNDRFMARCQRLLRREDFLPTDNKEEAMTGWNLKGNGLFQAVLDSDSLRKAFIAFSWEQWCPENIMFYMDVRAFQTQTLADSAELLKAAKVIYGKYIFHHGELEINIDSSCHQAIANAMSQGEVTTDLFTPAQNAVFVLMEKDTFAKWTKTVAFRDALSRVLPSSVGAGQ